MTSSIGSEIYRTLVRYAEGGERVVKVVLPEKLFQEFEGDRLTRSMLKTLKVAVEVGEVEEPKFYTGEIK